jgi:hypothetical protein
MIPMQHETRMPELSISASASTTFFQAGAMGNKVRAANSSLQYPFTDM